MNSLKQIIDGKTFHRDQAKDFMNSVRRGQLSDEITSSTLAVMSFRGETAEEIAGMAEDIFENLTQPFTFEADTLDVCGTGGDHSGSFNISTTVALLLAACGVNVVKHGNKSVSSRSGSADMLQALGLPLTLPGPILKQMLTSYKFAFFFAPSFHQAFKKIAPLRQRMQVKTIFNLLGPLVNPMRPTRQMVGVYNKKFIGPIAESLRLLNRKRAIVVSADSGFDEFSTFEKSHYALLNDQKISHHVLDPKQFGLQTASLEKLQGSGPQENAEICKSVLAGENGPRADIVNLNAGAALFAADKVTSIEEGYERVLAVQQSGQAYSHLQKIIQLGASHQGDHRAQ